MSKGSSKATPSNVDALLQEKQQLEEWIERLDLASPEDVPSEIRQKVREDYEGRLATVLEELNNYADELRDALKEEVATREELWAEEKGARDRISEAGLRHTVGEFTDKQWQEIQAEVDEVVGRVSAALENSTAEISRLEDVLGAMNPASRPPVKVEAPETAPSDSRDETEESPRVDGEEEEESEINQVEAFDDDDITFIKSDRSTAQSDAREPDGDDETAVADARAETEEKVEEKVPRPSTIGVEVAMPKAEKTLKCGECAGMNFPTEWYCEHCGAELASL